MYLKLAFGNAKRSAFDYLLYIFTMIILVSIMCVSNCIAVSGQMQLGFGTASLPLLIVLIMVVLIAYINTFMMKQRAKEFATYSLLGMDKNKLSLMFILEICIIGIVCFVLGVFLGTIIYYMCIFPMLYVTEKQFTLTFALMLKSVLQTFLYFCAVELISAFLMKRKICQLQIRELMKEKNRNQKISGDWHSLWRILFICSISCSLIMLAGIAFLSGTISSIAISFIAIPMLLSILAFYKCLFTFIASKRLAKSDVLYKDTNIYSMAEMTMVSKQVQLLTAFFAAACYFLHVHLFLECYCSMKK